MRLSPAHEQESNAVGPEACGLETRTSIVRFPATLDSAYCWNRHRAPYKCFQPARLRMPIIYIRSIYIYRVDVYMYFRLVA